MAFDPALGQLFLFDAEELHANNEGRLTSEQLLLLRNAARITDRQLKRSRVWVPFVLLAALAASAYGLAQTPGTDTKDVLLPVAILAWIAAIVLFFARRGRRYQQAYAHPQLRSVEGEGAFSPTSSSTGSWHLKVAGVTFVVESLATDRMSEGARYRVSCQL